MARFIKPQDYGLVARQEILNLLDNQENTPDLLNAENTAISQIKKKLAKRKDVAAIFTPAPTTGNDTRDPYIVMLVMDIALYHLWTGKAPGQIPTTRKERYQDAIEWLKDEGSGLNASGDLPDNEDGDYQGDVRISSRPPENHKW